MEVGGHARWRRYRDDSGNLTRMTTEHSGSWKWEGHEGWLTDTVSGLYTMDLQRGDAGGRITLDGAAQVWSEELFFEQLTLEEGDCAWAPVGALRVRDPSGGWYRVDFGSSCGPCGEATFAGEPAGSVCVDLSEVPARLDEQLRELQEPRRGALPWLVLLAACANEPARHPPRPGPPLGPTPSCRWTRPGCCAASASTCWVASPTRWSSTSCGTTPHSSTPSCAAT